jgi:hypothetical protein
LLGLDDVIYLAELRGFNSFYYSASSSRFSISLVFFLKYSNFFSIFPSFIKC